MRIARVYPFPLSLLVQQLELKAQLVYALLPTHMDLRPFLEGAAHFLAPEGHLLLAGELSTLCRANHLLTEEGFFTYDLVLVPEEGVYREAVFPGALDPKRLVRDHLQALVAFRHPNPLLAPGGPFPSALVESLLPDLPEPGFEYLIRTALDLDSLVEFPSLQPPLRLLAHLLDRYAPLPSLVMDLGPGAGPMGLLAATLGREVVIQDEARRGLDRRLAEADKLSLFLHTRRGRPLPSGA